MSPLTLTPALSLSLIVILRLIFSLIFILSLILTFIFISTLIRRVCWRRGRDARLSRARAPRRRRR